MVDPLSSVLGATFWALHEWAVDRGADKLVQKRRLRAVVDPTRLLKEADAELTALRHAEFASLPDGDWAAAQHAVAASVDAAKIADMVETDAKVLVLVNAGRLRARVRSAGRTALASAVLDDAGHEAYHRLLDQSCEKIAKQARTVEEVMRSLQVATADKVEAIKTAVDGLARQPDLREARQAAGFERDYADFVAQDNATFEMFEVSKGQAPERYGFGQFYTVPSIARRQRTEDDAELTGAGTDGADAIASARRVLLLGGAGSGKTTFFRWLAHTAAVAVRDGHDGPWRDAVPFFVPLRQFADRELPGVEEFVEVSARALTGEKPSGWVSRLLRSGRAMVLVDGVDELLVRRREEVRSWLSDLVRAYPDARYVVSTRPSAVDDDWPVAGDGFARFELLPLSVNGLRSLIGHWFKAAREIDPEQSEWLTNCEQRLSKSLFTRPKVRTLVSSPLLCSLLCALYRNENMYLPQSHKELLDNALDLLLSKWDVQREIKPDIEMSKKEKIILLERFAAPMVSNGELQVGKKDAEARFSRAMEGLRSQELERATVLQYMLERTGLLRENPVDHKIQFVHRTFRDFLAAGEFVKAGQLRYLIEQAHDDSWNEVVFMAAAQTRAREAGDLLGGLLTRARREPQVTNRLELLAAASLGYVDVIDPETVRTDVQAAVRRLIPPGSFDDAAMLARAGSFVVDLLPGPIEVGKHAEETRSDRAEVAARVIRTLALIGGEEGWEKIQAFAGTHRRAVIDELLRAWRQFDYSEEYARILLSDVDFGESVLEVHKWDVLVRLRHLRKLTGVRLIGNLWLSDPRKGLYPLADLPSLGYLEIRSNEACHDLAGLAGCRELRVLRVSGWSGLRDLSALTGLGVEELQLHTLGRFGGRRWVVDLGTLAGAGLHRLAIRHPGLEDGLHPLPADLPLTELELHGRAENRSLLGVERWPGLEKVTVTGIPSVEEVRALGELPALRHLVLHRPDPIGELVRLRPLGRLCVELFGVPRSEHGTARDALPEADLVLHAGEDEPPDNLPVGARQPV